MPQQPKAAASLRRPFERKGGRAPTDKLKKLWALLRSMRFAMGLLALMALACVAGSLIPQGEAPSYYQGAYPRAGGVILALGLDDVFFSPWFLVLTGFLCLSLILCSLARLPALVWRTRGGFAIEHCPAPAALAGEEGQVRSLFVRMGFRRVREVQREGRPALYACKNRGGIWGAWLCHLGVLVIIIAFGFGQLFQFETSVYGVVGQTLEVPGTDLEVTIEDFSIALREDETVEQYTAALRVEDRVTGERGEGLAQVNHPLGLFGLKFYQNSTGWAATAAVEAEGETVQERVLCAGETMAVEAKPGLGVQLRALYPDYAPGADGMPATASSQLKDPAYLYMLTYDGQILGMNVLLEGETITVDDVTIAFRDPQPYTLLEIKRDPFEKLAALGGALVLCALLLAFYCQTGELWAAEDAAGTWRVDGRSRGGRPAELRERGAALGLVEISEEDETP